MILGTWMSFSLKINGELQYLWRAVDQDGDVIDILVQSRRDQHAAERFFQRLLRGQGKEPFRIVTDKLKSYGAAKRTMMPSVTHDTRSARGCNHMDESLRLFHIGREPQRLENPQTRLSGANQLIRCQSFPADGRIRSAGRPA